MDNSIVVDVVFDQVLEAERNGNRLFCRTDVFHYKRVTELLICLSEFLTKNTSVPFLIGTPSQFISEADQSAEIGFSFDISWSGAKEETIKQLTKMIESFLVAITNGITSMDDLFTATSFSDEVQKFLKRWSGKTITNSMCLTIADKSFPITGRYTIIDQPMQAPEFLEVTGKVDGVIYSDNKLYLKETAQELPVIYFDRDLHFQSLCDILSLQTPACFKIRASENLKGKLVYGLEEVTITKLEEKF